MSVIHHPVFDPKIGYPLYFAADARPGTDSKYHQYVTNWSGYKLYCGTKCQIERYVLILFSEISP